ncbi:MAG: FMN-binding protein [Planctomycetota bacterium]|jgi:hypothetical protein
MKVFFLCVTWIALAGGPGKLFHTQEQALQLAFGEKTEVRSTTHYWTKEQRAMLAELAGVEKVRGTQVEYRRAAKKGKVQPGYSVWFDTRIVRSKVQTLMVVVDEAGHVRDLVVCNFAEPLDYKPVDRWYAQFEGRRLDEELQLKKGIHGVSGATLTARSTTAAVREVLAAHAVAHPPANQEKDPPKSAAGVRP